MFADASLILIFGVFAVSAVVITVTGTLMTGIADRLADRTGLGEAIVGGIILGAATSLSGTVVSVTAALDGRASLAFSNGVGGIVAQTAFLALADILHRRANLEHAAADLANVFQGALLSLLLALPILAWTTPEFTLFQVHPVSVVLVLLYIQGMRASYKVRQNPMWRPVYTSETKPDEPDPEPEDPDSTPLMVAKFVGLMIMMGTAGYFVSQTAGATIDRLGINASLVGAAMTAVVTSLPELVTTLAAVRRGALQLAMGGIIGGNSFDALFLTVSDVAYRDGSLYHAATSDDYFWLTLGIVVTATLTLGQLYRERQGPGGIGLESLAILGVYVGAIALQAFA